jgi:hypothetical protein
MSTEVSEEILASIVRSKDKPKKQREDESKNSSRLDFMFLLNIL